MYLFFWTSNSRVQFQDTRLFIAELILPLRLLYCVAGLCANSFPTARFRNTMIIYFHLYSTLTVLCNLKKEFRNGVQPQSKKGISENVTILRNIG